MISLTIRRDDGRLPLPWHIILDWGASPLCYWDTWSPTLEEAWCEAFNLAIRFCQLQTKEPLS